MNPYGPQQLANAIRTVRKNTILVAEDIPEESYGYRVTPDSRSVTETLLHIASAPQIVYYIHGWIHVSIGRADTHPPNSDVTKDRL